MKILWCITGAGHLLKESIKVLDKLSDNNTITIAATNAAEEVMSSYGFTNKIKEILNKNKSNKLITQRQEEHSYPFSGKLTQNNYDLAIISPATANTVAKIVHGIADTLVTNIAAQSGKGRVPLLVVPVDKKEGLVKTTLPPCIDRKVCTVSPGCNAKLHCPANAINPPHIDALKCIGCKACQKTCTNNAIKIGGKIQIHIRKIDAENTGKLSCIENATVLDSPNEIMEHVGNKK